MTIFRVSDGLGSSYFGTFTEAKACYDKNKDGNQRLTRYAIKRMPRKEIVLACLRNRPFDCLEMGETLYQPSEDG